MPDEDKSFIFSGALDLLTSPGPALSGHVAPKNMLLHTLP